MEECVVIGSKMESDFTQDMPYIKPSMGDSTLHSVSVVAVVSDRQG